MRYSFLSFCFLSSLPLWASELTLAPQPQNLSSQQSLNEQIIEDGSEEEQESTQKDEPSFYRRNILGISAVITTTALLTYYLKKPSSKKPDNGEIMIALPRNTSLTIKSNFTPEMLQQSFQHVNLQTDSLFVFGSEISLDSVGTLFDALTTQTPEQAKRNITRLWFGDLPLSGQGAHIVRSLNAFPKLKHFTCNFTLDDRALTQADLIQITSARTNGKKILLDKNLSRISQNIDEHKTLRGSIKSSQTQEFSFDIG